MSEDEWRAFVSAGTRTGKVATTHKDGRPHVTPVWFILDGEQLVFTTRQDTVKGRGLRRTGQIAVCVDDEQPPYGFAVIEGVVTLDDDQGRLRDYATRIAARYVSPEQAEEFGRRNASLDALIVHVTPTHVVAMADVAD